LPRADVAHQRWIAAFVHTTSAVPAAPGRLLRPRRFGSGFTDRFTQPHIHLLPLSCRFAARGGCSFLPPILYRVVNACRSSDSRHSCLHILPRPQYLYRVLLHEYAADCAVAEQRFAQVVGYLQPASLDNTPGIPVLRCDMRIFTHLRSTTPLVQYLAAVTVLPGHGSVVAACYGARHSYMRGYLTVPFLPATSCRYAVPVRRTRASDTVFDIVHTVVDTCCSGYAADTPSFTYTFYINYFSASAYANSRSMLIHTPPLFGCYA